MARSSDPANQPDPDGQASSLASYDVVDLATGYDCSVEQDHYQAREALDRRHRVLVLSTRREPVVRI